MSSVGTISEGITFLSRRQGAKPIAFRVIFSSSAQNQNILMRTIVLTNLLIKLLFSFNSLLLKKLKGDSSRFCNY